MPADLPRDSDAPAIDGRFLDWFLELGLKERIQSAANSANATQRLRRL